MIEMVKLLADAATKLIPVSDLLKQKREDEIGEIGLKLFDFYNSTIKVAQGGNELIAALRHTISRHKFYFQTHGKFEIGDSISILPRAIHDQSLLLQNLLQTAGQLRPLASIAESSSETSPYDTLIGLIEGKAILVLSSLNSFEKGSGLGSLWFTVELGRARDVLNLDIEGVEFANFDSSMSARIHGMQDSPEKEIIKGIVSRSLRIDEYPWSQKVNAVAETYVCSGLADRRVSEIVDAATKFRSAFQARFKMETVLFAAEKRLKRNFTNPI